MKDLIKQFSNLVLSISCSIVALYVSCYGKSHVLGYCMWEDIGTYYSYETSEIFEFLQVC